MPLSICLYIFLLNRYFMKIKSHNHIQAQKPHSKNGQIIAPGKGSKDGHEGKENDSSYPNIGDNNKAVGVITRNYKRNVFKESIVGNADLDTRDKQNKITIPAKKQSSIVPPPSNVISLLSQPTQPLNIAPSLSPQSAVSINRQQQQYHPEILAYLKKKSHGNKISSTYLRNHQNLTRQYRCSFIKHFFRLKKNFNLTRKTVFLAVYVMDAYFQKIVHIDKKEATVYALACIFIAMKYQEIYPPELSEWTQPNSDIIHAQSKILIALNFNITVPTLQTYLEYYLSSIQKHSSQPILKYSFSSTEKDTIQFLADICLFDQSILHGYQTHELSLALIYSIVNRNKIDEKMEMSLKWMMERNQKYVVWMQELKTGRNGKLVGNQF